MLDQFIYSTECKNQSNTMIITYKYSEAEAHTKDSNMSIYSHKQLEWWHKFLVIPSSHLPYKHSCNLACTRKTRAIHVSELTLRKR